MPDYACANHYKTLCEFARRMGLEIVYRDSKSFPDSVLAYCDVNDLEDGRHKCVYMPFDSDGIVAAGKEPSVVLAHEITHYLIEEFYKDDGIINCQTSYPIRLMIENDCDRMGLAIYLLANAIADEDECFDSGAP